MEQVDGKKRRQVPLKEAKQFRSDIVLVKSPQKIRLSNSN